MKYLTTKLKSMLKCDIIHLLSHCAFFIHFKITFSLKTYIFVICILADSSVDPWTHKNMPESCGYYIKCVEGIFKLFMNEESYNNNDEAFVVAIPTWDEFKEDKKKIYSMALNGPE